MKKRGGGNIMLDNHDTIDPDRQQQQQHQQLPPSLRDDCTVASGQGGGAWSVDGSSSSVTERIMGRMKRNLSNFGSFHLKSNYSSRHRGSFGGGSSGAHNNNDDISSMGSAAGGGGHRRRGSGRFGVSVSRIRRKSESKHNPFDFDRSYEDLGGGDGGDFRRRRSSSWSKVMSKGFRSHNNKGAEDSSLSSARNFNTESGSLRGRKGRIQLSNYSRGRGLNDSGITIADDDSSAPPLPVEYSLAELRSMNEDDLIHTMQIAGVKSEDISNAILQASSSSVASMGNATITSEEDIVRRKKNSLVALFVNSGHVKLVLKDVTTTTTTAQKLMMSPSNQDTVTSNYDTNTHITSASVATTAATSVNSTRKSKLEKIAELKIENGNVRAENKSLKKLVKKLLGQLSAAVEERDNSSQQNQHQQSVSSLLVEANAIAPSFKKGNASPLNTLHNSSLRSIEEIVDIPRDAYSDGDVIVSFPPSEVVARFDGESESDVKFGNAQKHAKFDGSGSSTTDSARSRKSVSAVEASSPSSSSSKTMSQLRHQLKKEKEAHDSTKFRMKTEIEILSNEVNGLQRELGLTLESLDEVKEQSREYKESMHNLKRELRHVSKKMKEMHAEAEARDRLIETFSNILLKKIDGINSSGDEGGDNATVGEEKRVEKLVAENLVIERGTSPSVLPHDYASTSE